MTRGVILLVVGREGDSAGDAEIAPGFLLLQLVAHAFAQAKHAEFVEDVVEVIRGGLVVEDAAADQTGNQFPGGHGGACAAVFGDCFFSEEGQLDIAMADGALVAHFAQVEAKLIVTGGGVNDANQEVVLALPTEFINPRAEGGGELERPGLAFDGGFSFYRGAAKEVNGQGSRFGAVGLEELREEDDVL